MIRDMVILFVREDSFFCTHDGCVGWMDWVLNGLILVLLLGLGWAGSTSTSSRCGRANSTSLLVRLVDWCIFLEWHFFASM